MHDKLSGVAGALRKYFYLTLSHRHKNHLLPLTRGAHWNFYEAASLWFFDDANDCWEKVGSWGHNNDGDDDLGDNDDDPNGERGRKREGNWLVTFERGHTVSCTQFTSFHKAGDDHDDDDDGLNPDSPSTHYLIVTCCHVSWRWGTSS